MNQETKKQRGGSVANAAAPPLSLFSAQNKRKIIFPTGFHFEKSVIGIGRQKKKRTGGANA